jgi:hypothetical protein
VLTRQGVTAWHRTLTEFTPTPARSVPVDAAARAAVVTVPAPIAAELIDALAAVTLAGTVPAARGSP